MNRPAALVALAALAAMGASRAADEPVVDFVVARSDTLRGLSKSVLTTPDAWREVARLNRLPNADRIAPGQVLKIPMRLMRSDPVGASLVSASGEVRVDDAAAAQGATVGEGQSIRTGADGSAVLALADGSRVTLPPSSLAQVTASRRVGVRSGLGTEAPESSSGWFAGTLRLLRGSVEVLASKVRRARPLEVVTPTAVVGVRGTRYRVGVDDAAGERSRGEVIEGLVRFDATNAGAGADLAGGFGAVADASKTAPKVVPLLPAPDLAAVPERFERPLVRFTLAGDRAAAWRVQVASDAGFDKIVSDQRVAAGTDVRIAGLGDASWHLRARGIDTQGIEGFDTSRRFVLKARPEPPVYRAPRSDAKQPVGSVEFAWAQNTDGPRARFQLAEDAQFTRIVEQREPADSASLRLALTRPGVYFWRLASVRANDDNGPFGDTQRFELRPLPEPPSGGLSADGAGLRFGWSGRPEDRQQVEFASDADFKQLVAQDTLVTAEWVLAAPRGGRYYFRYRSIEPDGYVSPYSSTLVIDVPRDWSPLLLLLPLLLL